MLTKFFTGPASNVLNTLNHDRSARRPKIGEKRPYPFTVEIGPKPLNENKRRHVAVG